MASAEETPETPIVTEMPQCFICNQEFDSDRELVDHLLEHANEEKFKTLLAELESQNKSKPPVSSIPFSTIQRGPSFIRTSFVNESRKKSTAAAIAHAEPEIVDLASDDESNANQESNSKKAKVSRPIASGSLAKNPSSETGPPFKCNSCASVFNDAAAFRSHLLTHERPRPYICHICKKSFASKGALRQHLHMHIGERLHECRFCHKKFTIKSVLRKHEESHELQHLQERRNNI